MIQPNEETQQIRSVQFITIGKQEDIPAPLIRIATCGLLTVEIAEEVIGSDPPQVRYASLTPEQLRGRGTGPALMLLKLLLSRPERFASRAWLIEQFCRDGEIFSSVRIDNIVSQLRGLLCPPASQVLRKQLVAHVRNSGSDGYQLAASPLIWCDQDALAWNVEQATRMERFQDNALPFWERAYELARRGPYLPGDVYNDWATFRREEVAGMLRQSVQALARIYQAQHGAAGEEEALRLLRSYWLEHLHEEDILRPLMELLGRRECTHEALKYYARLYDLLKEDECEPDALTQDVAQYLQNKQQLQRRPLVFRLTQQNQATFSAQTVNADAIESKKTQLEIPFHISPAYSDTWQEISSTSAYLHANPGEILNYFQQLLELSWKLSNAGTLDIAERVLSSFLPHLSHLFSSQPEVALLLAEGLRLQSLFAAHQQNLPQKLTACLQSVEYARQSGNTNILIAELTELAVAFEYVQQLKNAFSIYQEALSLADQASPLIRSRLYGKSAIAFARNGQTQKALFLIQAAYDCFPDHPEAEVDFLSSDHGLYKLARHKGLMYLALDNPSEAIKSFRSEDVQFAPARSRLEILNDLGKTAILLNDFEQYTSCLEEGMVGSLALKSKKRLDEVLQTFHNVMPHAWSGRPQIRRIIEEFQSVIAGKERLSSIGR